MAKWWEWGIGLAILGGAAYVAYNLWKGKSLSDIISPIQAAATPEQREELRETLKLPPEIPLEAALGAPLAEPYIPMITPPWPSMDTINAFLQSLSGGDPRTKVFEPSTTAQPTIFGGIVTPSAEAVMRHQNR